MRHASDMADRKWSRNGHPGKDRLSQPQPSILLEASAVGKTRSGCTVVDGLEGGMHV